MHEYQPQDRLISTPHGRLFARKWEVYGAEGASPLILSHDSLGSVEQWRDLPARLAATTGRSVIAYDRLGFGRSDRNSNTLPRSFIQDEASLGIDYVHEAFGVDRMILFGHSVGGGMSLAGAAALGEMTDAVIAIAAQTFVEDRTIAGIEVARTAFRDPAQMEKLARYHGGKARWVLDAWIETWTAPSFRDWVLDADLRRISCPVLAIHGEQDEYGSSAHPERIAELSPARVQLELMAGCRHMPHREMPDEVLRLVGEFLRTI